MDGQRFDDLARVFSASLNRKGFLAIVAGIAAPAVLSEDGAARKRKKRNRGNRGGDVAPQGGLGIVCSGSCDDDEDCADANEECVCDRAAHLCVAPICGGVCLKDTDCQGLPGCSCQFVGLGDEKHCVTATCGSICEKGNCGGVEGDSCVCNFNTDLCVTVACFGFCENNAECQEQGQGNCACFFGSGVDVASAAAVEAAAAGRSGPAGPSGLGIEGGTGPSGPTGPLCGTCIGDGLPCNASTECCGQLVCRESGERLSVEGEFAGTCQLKPPKPNDRCGKHGQNCQRDNDCCAQAVCFKGKCGEKDSHCNNGGECAPGYRCQGGPLAPGHRRCRKNGRKRRNKTHRRHG